MWSCGNNEAGQLGLGNNNGDNFELKKILSDQIFRSVSCGYSHTIAIDSNECLWSCGDNSDGQLGLGDTVHRNSLTKIFSGQKFSSISCGGDYTTAVDYDGYLWCCGSNYVGQLGLNDETDKYMLTKAPNLIVDTLMNCLPKKEGFNTKNDNHFQSNSPYILTSQRSINKEQALEIKN